MKVLFLIGSVGMGGHTRSALAIGRALADRGIDVHFAAGEGKGIDLVTGSGLPCSIFPTGFRDGYVVDGRSFQAVARIAGEVRPDVYHAFDFNGLMLGAGPARRSTGKLLFTICGGPVPRARVPAMRPVVVFSRELKEGLLERQGLDEEHILVNAARIRLEQNVFPPERISGFRSQVGIPDGEPVVLMISRIARSKIPALLHLVKTADRAAEKSRGVFLIVGAADEPQPLTVLQEAVARVNAKHGRPIVLWTDRGSEQASRLLPLASVAVGVGRTAFEAMNLGIPTLVIGNHGFSAVACEQTCDALIEKNFSGRDALDRPAEASSPEVTAEVLCRILNDPCLSEKIGREGRQWVRDHLSAERGAEFYAGLYEKDLDFYRLPEVSSIYRLYAGAVVYRLYKQLFPAFFQNMVSRRRQKDLLPELST